MKKFIAAIILILLGSAACASEPAKNFCGATDNMLSADYWKMCIRDRADTDDREQRGRRHSLFDYDPW